MGPQYQTDQSHNSEPTLSFYNMLRLIKAMLTNDTDYSHHIQPVYNLSNQSYGVHIMPLVINSLGGWLVLWTETYEANS